MRELFLIPLVVAACANPGGPYSDLASATLGDPGVDGGIAGNVDFTNQGCELPDGGVYATKYVEEPGGTCGPVTAGYVNGASLAASPYCPGGAGSVKEDRVATDAGFACFVSVSLESCAVSGSTTVVSTGETGTWSPGNATFSGSTTVLARVAGTECASTYDITFTLQ
jgi:hypothetical protein